MSGVGALMRAGAVIRSNTVCINVLDDATYEQTTQYHSGQNFHCMGNKSRDYSTVKSALSLYYVTG